MMVAGLARRGSTTRARSSAADSRAPTPARSGARSPWKRSSGMGARWHSRHMPTWRSATMALPRAGLPSASALPVKSAAAATPTTSHQLDPMGLQRHRADGLAGGAEVRVRHRARRDADGRLAYAAPDRTARLTDDGLDLGHLRDREGRIV